MLGSKVSLTTTGDNQLSEHSTLSFADATSSLKSDPKQTIGGLEGNGNITIGDSLTVGVNNSDTIYGGQISSEGGLYKVGTGTLTLTNEQLYEGGTFVQDGVLALGENGKFWDESDFTLTGGVLDLGGKSQKASSLLLDGGAILNGKLETTGNLELKSGEFGIDLIGDSALEKSGDGTLVISGDNSGYSGVTTVSAGEVQGTIAAFGTSNKIVNNGQVTFTDSGEANWDGAITGTGSLALTGGGDYRITGNDNTYSGQTLIQNASLTLNGELSNSDVIIENGGRFGGNNTVGSLTANGIIAPGNSIGVITTIGDFTLGKDGIYEVEVAANGENDRIIVGGKAYLEGGSIHVTALDDKVSYQQVQTHTFLTAEGGIEGEFSEAVTRSIFLRTQLDHQDDHVKLNVAVLPEDRYFENVATTSNQKSVARALESLEQAGSALALYNSVLFSENENDARHAFTQLSGDSHASTKTALIDAINRAGDVVNNRIRAAFEGVASKDLPVLSYAGSGASKDTQAFDAVEGANSSVGYAAWATGFGSWLNHDSNANAGGLKASTGGFMSGVDMGFASGWRVGITGGYSQTDIKGKNRSASATSDNWHLGVYGGNQWGPLGLRAGLIHTWSSIDASRSVIYPGLNERLKADYDARTLQVFGEVGYRFDTTSAAFEPFVNLSHIRLHTDSFTETGGISRLAVESDNTNTTFTTLGLRAAAPVDLGSMTAQIKGTAGWRHAFNDVTPSSTQAFIDSNSFTVGGIPIAKDTALIEAGIDFAVSPTATLGLSYVGQYGSHAVQNGFNANLSVKF